MPDVSGSALTGETLVLHDASLGPQATPWIPVGVSAASGALAAWFLLPQVVSGASTAYAAVFWVCLSVYGTFSLAAYCASRAFGVLEGGDSPVHRIWALALAGNASLFVPLAILVRQQQSLAVVWTAFIGLGFAVLVRRYPGDSRSATWKDAIEPPLFRSVATTAPSPERCLPSSPPSQ